MRIYFYARMFGYVQNLLVRRQWTLYSKHKKISNANLFLGLHGCDSSSLGNVNLKHFHIIEKLETSLHKLCCSVKVASLEDS